jgi:hypothetical protein
MAMITSLHVAISELEKVSPKIATLSLASTIPEERLEGERLDFVNTSAEIAMVGRAVEHLSSGLSVSDAALRKMLTDLLSSANFYGQLCEFAVYDWLNRNNASFRVQIAAGAQDVLNPNGSDLDGVFDARNVHFDVKGFGFEAYVREKLRKKIAELVRHGRVLIDGPRDNSVKDLQKAFGRSKAIAAELSQSGLAKVPELGWTLRISASPVSIEQSSVDPYRMAEENRYYPFKTARQFHRNTPFLLIFAFSPAFNGFMSVDFDGSSGVFFRSLARRAFMQSTGDMDPVLKHDSGADSAVTIHEASRLLSGLLFLDFGDSEDTAWLFLNPRAKHRLKKDHVEQMFDFLIPKEMSIDDFEHDNY